MALVIHEEQHGNITITQYRDAPPSISTRGHEDDRGDGLDMTGMALIAAVTAYLTALDAWIHQQAARHE